MAEGKGTRLIPKDFSNNLGKLPPQNLEMEEAVLGALMIERPALAEVIDILKPDHFYTEVHKEIYNAILAVHSESNPVDMRTVIHKLRATGKIELIGGAYYITELTSKVSSASNVRTHAALVVETGLKRAMIMLATKIHTQAYEDDCDAFELLDKIASEFEFFKKFNLPQNNEQRIKALWEKTLLINEPEEDVTLISLDGTPIVVEQNHTLIVGKKKSRKTLFIAMIVSYFLKEFPMEASRVLLFDTEQGKSHVWKIRKKIHALTGLWVPIFYLRGMPPAERRQFITDTVTFWPHPPHILVIDGVRDCMSNINDPVETTDVLVWLEKMLLNKLAIIEVLHLNKTDNNARGHIGTELLNKAVCTIEMELKEDENCTIVKCESSRDRAFETFAFTHDADALPMIVGTPVKGTVIPMDEKRRRLNDIFEAGNLKYGELVEEIKVHFELGVGRAKSMVAELLRQGYIMKSGKPRDPDTVYKLLSTVIPPNGHEKAPKTLVGKAVNGQQVREVEKIELNIFEPDDLPF